VLKGKSATSVNRAIDTLRRILDIALERGQIHVNPVSIKPAEGRLKKKVVAKKIILPCRDEARQVIAAIRKAGAYGGWGIDRPSVWHNVLVKPITWDGGRSGILQNSFPPRL
jgi:hypothetical protein